MDKEVEECEVDCPPRPVHYAGMYQTSLGILKQFNRLTPDLCHLLRFANGHMFSLRASSNGTILRAPEYNSSTISYFGLLHTVKYTAGLINNSYGASILGDFDMGINIGGCTGYPRSAQYPEDSSQEEHCWHQWLPGKGNSDSVSQIRSYNLQPIRLSR